jgi:DNA-directed RNA polymerase
MEDLADQLKREEIMAERGRARAQGQIEKALNSERASDTPGGIALVKRGIEPLTNAIKTFIEQALSGRPGRKNQVAVLLKDVPADVAAYITMKMAVNAAVAGLTLRSAGLRVALHLADELVAQAFEAKEEALYRAIVRNATLRGLGQERIAKSIDLANRKFNVTEKVWTDGQRQSIGIKLIELAIESLGVFETEFVKLGPKHTTYRLKLTPKIHGWLRQYNDRNVLTRPMYLPTVIPPQRWETPRGSPYWGHLIETSAIITKTFKGHLEALQAAPMPTVYTGLNAIQETPWRINRRVLRVMEEAWERDAGLPCLPSREDVRVPEAPPEVVNDVKGGVHRKAWRQKMRAIHEANAATRSNRFEFARCLQVAQDYRFEKAIYFPHRLDFRGRCYAAATSLQPQGADHAKGLLEFSEGKPLGERGVFWLGVHGANVFGNDKVSLDERYEWACRFVDKATRIANDPLGNLEWTEADKPWSFLAWCFEWAGVYAEVGFHGSGEDFVSHLPIALDGSCNGIQHFSAMLRDPVGGAAVNLVPGDKPNDIYAQVADRTIELLKQETDPELEWVAQSWIKFGINRKTTKRSVMVLPYGGTFRSCMEYVRDAVRERIQEGEENPFGAELPKHAAYLAKVVWQAIGDIVIASRAAMDWLQKCASLATSYGVPLRWSTPSGFVCVQHYQEVSDLQLKTRFLGTIIKFAHPERKNKIDASRQRSAVAPNFVHSMDAAAMMRTIEACLGKGIKSFAMIHDSYGTHAADTDLLAQTIREEFVRMYEEHDVLQDFEADLRAVLPEEALAELPQRPPMGSLDLRAVLQSAYFFA